MCTIFIHTFHYSVLDHSNEGSIEPNLILRKQGERFLLTCFSTVTPIWSKILENSEQLIGASPFLRGKGAVWG